MVQTIIHILYLQKEEHTFPTTPWIIMNIQVVNFDGTSSEGRELPHCIIRRGEKMVQIIRETGPEDHTGTVN
jgi:hypothetical protein